MKRNLQPYATHGSLRRQIILTFVLGFFVLISLFVAYTVNTEKSYLYRDNTLAATSLAESLAASSLSWVLANDVVGLQESIQSFRGYPEFNYAMVISDSGRVLAHSDPSKIGQYISDQRSRELLGSAAQNRILVDDPGMVDIAVPLKFENRQVGWARIALSRNRIADKIEAMIQGSAAFVVFASCLSLFAAIILARRLAGRIGSMTTVTEQVRAGNNKVRVQVAGSDEVARLAANLNEMLDKLTQASAYSRSLIEASLDPLVTISRDGKIMDVNQALEAATGANREQLIGSDFSDYFTEPEKARQGYQLVLSQGFVKDYQLAIRHASGKVIDVVYNATVFRNEAGEVQGVFAAARDVTERRLLEDKIRERSARLENMLQQAQEAVSVLASSSSEILNVISQLAATSSEAASSVSETTATVEEVRQTAQLSNQKAKDIAQNGQNAAQVLASGQRNVDAAVAEMNRIREQMDQIGETIMALSEQSQAIGEITGTVNELAEQSNLLAVNAAIEAARAGEQGKGFAVVAQEIKRLAAQSKQATQQVRRALLDIQKAIGNAVMAAEQAAKVVEAGVLQSNQAGESIRLAVDATSNVANASTQIAASSQQQLIGVDQVATAMENINQASLQNADSTRQVEMVAQNLHELSQKLKALVEGRQPS